MKPVHILGELLRRALSHWWNDRAPRLGAALAYYGAFSIAPAAALVLTVGGTIFGDDAARGELVRQLESFLGKQGGLAVQATLASAYSTSRGFWPTSISIAVLLAGSFALLSELQDSLDTVWNTPPRIYPTWLALVVDKLRLYLVLAGVMLLFVVLIVGNLLIGWLIQFAPEWSTAALLHVISTLMNWLSTTVLFAITFKVMPNVRLLWRDVWLGAAVTAVLFIFGKYAIARYLALSAIATAHGAAGAFAALLIWLYYSALVFLFGAELTQSYVEWRRGGANGGTGTLQVPAVQA